MPSELESALASLYRVFARYPLPRPLVLCGYCYTSEQLHRLQTTPLRDLSDEDARVLLWETFDHWDGTDAYKHFLPRMLARLAASEDVYPGHLFETLGALGFERWPGEERAVLSQFFDALEARYREEGDLEDAWTETRNRLKIFG